MPATPEQYAEVEAELARRRRGIMRVGFLLVPAALVLLLATSWQWATGYVVAHSIWWALMFTFHKRQAAEARRNLDAREPPRG